MENIKNAVALSIERLQSAYFDEDCYCAALEKAIREHLEMMTPEKRKSYERAYRGSLRNLEDIRVEIARRRDEVGKELLSLNQKIAA